MSYLTYEEYMEYGFNEIEQTEFDSLIKKASDAIDGITRYFYWFNDLDQDVAIRRVQFKKAVACQIEYFNELGGTTSQGLNDAGSVTIGRTSMSSGSRGNASSDSPKNGLVSNDAVRYLVPTGLLYQGIGVR